MKNTTLLRASAWALLCVGASLTHLAATAQIYIGEGSSLTIGPGSSVSVIGGDVTVEDGGSLDNNGLLVTDGDVLIQGTLRTVLRDTAAGAGFGQVRAGGQVVIDGNLQIAEATDSDFRGTVDFPIILHRLDRAGVFWEEALPHSAYSVLYQPGAVVAHLGEGRGQVASAKTYVERTALRLYPNPAWGEEVFVSGLGTERELRHVYLRSITGQRFATTTERHGDQLRVSISAYVASGMYLLELVGTDGVQETLPLVLGRE